MASQPKEIRRYLTRYGKAPFAEWFDSLRDIKTKTVVNKRLDRVSQGNLGDCQSVGLGVYELRIDYGPGYRIYFGQVGTMIVILLCGGDKSTQARDIRKAKEYWTDYEERDRTNK